MDKAIEIKRRAQRCILNGDLNGALAEYEKLVALGDPDPYYCVLLADLLYKMGNPVDAQKRYLEAVQGYSKAGLYKNGIAVCKKLSRLSLAPIEVPRWLAQLYSLDGLGTEAGLAYQQLAEVLIKGDRIDEARAAIQQAIQVSPDAARLYERLGEIEVLAGNNGAAGDAWSDALERFERAGQDTDVKRCRSRIAQLRLTPQSRQIEAPVVEIVPPVAKLEVSGTPAWKTPESGEIDFESMTISHTPPSPDEATRTDSERRADAAADVDSRGAVRVERGFEQLVGSVPAESSDDAEEFGIAVPAADAPDGAEFEAATAGDSTEGAIAGNGVGGPEPEVEIDAAVDAPAVVFVPAYHQGLSLTGLDPDEYEQETEPSHHPASVSESQRDQAPAPVASAPPVFEMPQAPPAFLTPPAPMAPVVPAVPPTFANPPEPAALPMPSGPPAPAQASESVLVPRSTLPLPQPQAPAAESVDAEAASGLGIERFSDAETPAQPGLAAAARNGTGSTELATPTAEAEDEGLARVSLILGEAQACFSAGDRDGATMALIRAAQAYDQMGRLDSAVAIYRSLGQSPDVSLQLMMLWLKNCQRRDDRPEAARVACDLGDRALNDGDLPGAREWFERAIAFDHTNELAERRLKLMDAPEQQGSAAPAAPGAGAAPIAAGAGHLNVRTTRDEPVIVDLGTLIEEFQRAVEPQLEFDPQGHYDLGMSYREMGLTEQAVQSLRTAAKAPAFRLRAGELAGRCLLDLGRFDEAAEALRDTLDAPDLLPSAAVDLRYQLALALEAAGDSLEALAEFERVYAAQANYPDVAMKIRLLRRTAEAA